MYIIVNKSNWSVIPVRFYGNKFEFNKREHAHSVADILRQAYDLDCVVVNIEYI